MAVLNFTEHLGRNGRDGMKLPSGEKKITTGRAVLPDSKNFNPRRGNLAADKKKRAPREQGALWSNKISARSDGERAAATASALNVGVVELEAGTLERLDVIDFHAVQVHGAHLVHS